MAKKGGLGRGFDSLFSENSADESSKITLRISEIEPNRDQPRKDFDETALEELAESIKEHGLLQPLLVRPVIGGGYRLVAGERRWRALRKAGIEEAPVIVREMTDKEASEIAMIENLQREDLNPIEEALGYKNLMENFSLTQDEVAERCSKSRSAVANAVRLLNLPEDILLLVRTGEISAGHGRAILSVAEGELRDKAVLLAKSGASVRTIEALAKTSSGKSKEKTPVKKDTYFKEVELALKNELGRRVKIDCKNAEKGTVTIEYYSKEDLAHIAEKLAEKR